MHVHHLIFSMLWIVAPVVFTSLIIHPRTMLFVLVGHLCAARKEYQVHNVWSGCDQWWTVFRMVPGLEFEGRGAGVETWCFSRTCLRSHHQLLGGQHCRRYPQSMFYEMCAQQWFNDDCVSFVIENVKRLFPKELPTKTLQRIIYFHRKVSRLPIGAISLGSFIHSDLCPYPKMPFIGPVRSGFLRKYQHSLTVVSKHCSFTQINLIVSVNRSRWANQHCPRTLCQTKSSPRGVTVIEGTLSGA